MSADRRVPAQIESAQIESAQIESARIEPSDVERWLGELDLRPTDRSDRDGISSWDLTLDGRRRYDVRVTLIFDPDLALIVWVHYAPPISDLFRKSYRRLLRWNDEYPFAKFALAEDERPVLTSELPLAGLDRDKLGLAIARLLAVCDQLLEESAGWLWLGGKIPDIGGRVGRNDGLLDRFELQLGELAGAGDSRGQAQTASSELIATAEPGEP